MNEERQNKQKQEVDEAAKERQKTILLIGVFLLVAVLFAIAGVATFMKGNTAAGLDKILGAIGLLILSVYYIIRDRKRK